MVQLFFGTGRQEWESFRGNNNAMAMLVVIDTSLFVKYNNLHEHKSLPLIVKLFSVCPLPVS